MANVVVLLLGIALYKQNFNAYVDTLVHETDEWN